MKQLIFNLPYLCKYRYCPEIDKQIAEGKAVECAVCADGKPMHAGCYERHQLEKHGGKGCPIPKKEKVLMRFKRSLPTN